MIQLLLELFTTKEKATAMLTSPIIEFIFMALFVLFVVTLIVHFTLFMKIKNIRNYIKSTERLDMEPLRTIKQQFDQRQTEEAVKVETFVQEKISSWHLLHIPVVSLIKLVHMTISVFILLGVLGTFIGLTISLGSIQTSGDQLVENIAGVLSGIDVAFYTSIIGMGFSLIMTVVVRIFNTEYLLTDFMLTLESQLEGQEQHGMPQMIHVSERIHQAIVDLQATNETSLNSIVDSFAGFKDYTSGLQQSAKDLAVFNDGLSENLTEFQTLFHEMKEVTDGFSAGTTTLNNHFTTLFTYFQKMDQRNERITKVFEQTYESIQKLQTSQLESFATFETSVDEWKDFTSNILAEQKMIHNELATMTKQFDQFVTTLGTHERKLAETFGQNLQTKLTELTKQMEESGRHFAIIGQNIQTLPQALEVMNNMQEEHKHLLQDRFRELQAFNEKFSDHIQQHATDSTHFDKQVREAGVSFGQMTTQNQQLIQEINRSIEQVKQIFTERDQQLDTNVAMVKDTLTNYVNSLEGTLGQKLDNVIRHLDNQMYQANDKMTREWSDMRRIADEVNQNNARTNEQLLQELTREIQTMNRQLQLLSNERTDSRTIGTNRHEF